MNDNNQNLNEVKDPLEPVILGTVKKGRTGNPIFAIVIILLIASLIYFLPVIGNYFGDNSIIDLIKKGELINYIKNKNSDTKNNSQKNYDEYILINGNNTLENSNLTISNISVKDNVLSYKIKSKTATYDASNVDLYLQIYVDKKTLVYTKILDEVFSITENVVKENVDFYNASNQYYATLKFIKSDDIEDIMLSSDESSLVSLNCSLNNDTYEYIFKKQELIEIKRTYQYKYDSEKADDYHTMYQSYNDLKNEREKYNIKIELAEDYIGFSYKEDVKLENVDVSLLGKNYYSYKTLAKVVKFKQEAKGYDCE